MAEITKEQFDAEDEFMRGLPRFNLGAFLLPPIWGPFHGFWITVLYYPAWLICDNLFYATYQNPTPLSIALAILAGVLLLVVTVVFGILSQPYAAHKADDRGVSRETYLRRERIWAIGCVIGAAVLIGLATYYNLAIRPFIAG